MFKQLANAAASAAGEAVSRATEAAADLTSGVLSFAGQAVPDTDALVEVFLNQTTPIVVPAHCVPTGPLPDDYDVVFDVDAFIDARINGPFVRPKIEVFAARTDLDRDILAARLDDAFKVAMKAAEASHSELKGKEGDALKKARDETVADIESGVQTTITLTVLGVILTVLGLGFVAPILALIGVANNIDMAKSGVRLLILEGKLRLVQLGLWPTEEGSLRREIESTRRQSQAAFITAVQQIEITIDDDLVKQLDNF